ncbi:hypothetical protein BC832DRAFT_128933 [Gaertneriomyces semiglobifer]|nr:hypothetical protein BC832DRAFT_128933 [Gaertneriomyces semiglobifer]
MFRWSRIFGWLRDPEINWMTCTFRDSALELAYLRAYSRKYARANLTSILLAVFMLALYVIIGNSSEDTHDPAVRDMVLRDYLIRLSTTPLCVANGLLYSIPSLRKRVRNTLRWTSPLWSAFFLFTIYGPYKWNRYRHERGQPTFLSIPPGMADQVMIFYVYYFLRINPLVGLACVTTGMVASFIFLYCTVPWFWTEYQYAEYAGVLLAQNALSFVAGFRKEWLRRKTFLYVMNCQGGEPPRPDEVNADTLKRIMAAARSSTSQRYIKWMKDALCFPFDDQGLEKQFWTWANDSLMLDLRLGILGASLSIVANAFFALIRPDHMAPTGRELALRATIAPLLLSIVLLLSLIPHRSRHWYTQLLGTTTLLISFISQTVFWHIFTEGLTEEARRAASRRLFFMQALLITQAATQFGLRFRVYLVAQTVAVAIHCSVTVAWHDLGRLVIIAATLAFASCTGEKELRAQFLIRKSAAGSAKTLKETDKKTEAYGAPVMSSAY